MKSLVKLLLWVPLLVLSFFLNGCGGSSFIVLAPSLVSLTNPQNGAVDISKATNFTVNFTTAVNPTSLTGSGVAYLVTGNTVSQSSNVKNKLVGASSNIQLTLQAVSTNQKTAVFLLPSGQILASNTSYQLQVNTSLIKTTSNQSLGSGVITAGTFTTGSKTIPVAALVNPANGAIDQSRSLSVQLAFSEAVDNVNNSNIKVAEASNESSVDITSITAGTNNTYTFNLNNLSANTKYNLTLNSNIVDLAGNALANTLFSFTTGSKSFPTVSLVTPSNGDTNLSLSPNIQLQFSEAVFNVTPGTTTPGTVNLYLNSCPVSAQDGGVLVSLNSITSGTNNTDTFSPSSNLLPNTTYCIALTNGITDASNASLVPTTFSFTTGNSTAPTVGIIHPSDNSTNASVYPSIQIQFSESVENVNSTNVLLYAGADDGCNTLGSQVAIGAITAGSNYNYAFSPAAQLNANSLYCIVLTRGITNSAGTALVPITFSFTTGTSSDPTSSMLTPTNNATSVAPSTPIVIQFSTPVQNVTTSTVNIYEGSTTGSAIAIGTISADSTNTVFTITPAATLSQNTMYYIVLNNGITAIANGDGISITTYHFTTGFYGWTWVNGTTLSTSNGVYGTKNIPASSNNPGARAFFASWDDTNNGILWVFGGLGFGASGSTNGRLNDLWKYNINTGLWTWVNGASIINVNGIYGTLGVASPSNQPGARRGSYTWRDSSGNLWLFGGNGFPASGGTNVLNDLWKYDIGTGLWTWVNGSSATNANGVYGTQGTASTSNMPGSRQLGGFANVESSNTLWLFGGQGRATSGGSADLNDLWKYDIGTGLWTWVSGASTGNNNGTYGTQGVASTANIPGGRNSPRSYMDSSGNSFWVYGGTGYPASGSTTVRLGDMWKYDINAGNWTWMNGGSTGTNNGVYGIQGVAALGNQPGTRAGPIGWTDTSGNFWLANGSGYGASGSTFGNLNDLWEYNPTTGLWTWINGSDTINPTAVYGTQGVASTANVLTAGGAATGFVDSSGNIWIYNPAGVDVFWKYGFN